mgnify:CR=1 FL=1
METGKIIAITLILFSVFTAIPVLAELIQPNICGINLWQSFYNEAKSPIGGLPSGARLAGEAINLILTKIETPKGIEVSLEEYGMIKKEVEN